MNKLRSIKVLINNLIEWLYPIFRKIVRIPMAMDTFRYAFCGGSNTLLDLVLYFITYNFILKKQFVSLGFITITPHIAAFLIVFPITFLTGFILAKYITFVASEMRGRVQLFRYGVTVAISIFLNYIFLKLFVEVFGFYPTFSKLLTTGLVVIYSFFSQKYFTFQMHKTSCAD